MYTTTLNLGKSNPSAKPKVMDNVVLFPAPRRNPYANVIKRQLQPNTSVIQAKDKAERAVAVFSTEYDKLRKLVGADAGAEISADLAYSAMLRAFLNVLLNAIPIAEKAYLRGGGVNSAYALSTLINNARELGRDITAKNSLEHQVNNILTEIISPTLRLILHQQVLNITNLRAALDNSGRNPSAMREAYNKSLQSTAQTLTDARSRIDDQIRKSLLSH
jgi:hypothetical protein